MFRDRPTLIIIRLEEYNYPAATAIAAIMVLLSFAMLVLVNLVQSWCRKRYADVTIVSPIGSDTAGRRRRALPDGSRVLVA
jgi:sulfate transport system permease protein